MSDREAISSPTSGQSGWFATTHWSIVLTAGECNSPQAADALEKLCRTYWYPLYAYVRRQGKAPHDAQDLTQEFFARLLRLRSLDQVAPHKGKFRTFLLASLKNFLADASDRAKAKKRGGSQAILSLDASEAEEHYQLEPVAALDAEGLYDLRWAQTVFEKAGERLKHEYSQNGKSELYERVRACLTKETSAPTYADLAKLLGCAEETVKSHVRRLRLRFRDLIREELGNTVSSLSEIDEEFRYLVDLLVRWRNWQP